MKMVFVSHLHPRTLPNVFIPSKAKDGGVCFLKVTLHLKACLMVEKF